MSRRNQSRRRRSYAPRQRELRQRRPALERELDDSADHAWQIEERGLDHLSADKQAGAEL